MRYNFIAEQNHEQAVAPLYQRWKYPTEEGLGSSDHTRGGATNDYWHPHAAQISTSYLSRETYSLVHQEPTCPLSRESSRYSPGHQEATSPFNMMHSDYHQQHSSPGHQEATSPFNSMHSDSHQQYRSSSSPDGLNYDNKNSNRKTTSGQKPRRREKKIYYESLSEEEKKQLAKKKDKVRCTGYRVRQKENENQLKEFDVQANIQNDTLKKICDDLRKKIKTMNKMNNAVEDPDIGHEIPRIVKNKISRENRKGT